MNLSRCHPSRRRLLGAAIALPFIGVKARAASAVTVTIDPAKKLRAIPENYMGLGFEISSVAVPGLLSAKNQAYVQLVKNLGRDGVIRIGGNTSDFSSYDANGAPQSLPKGTVVNAANLRELKTFIDATGWRLIWGLNLGADKLDNAVEEARAVAGIMGDRLIALELGNEPDLFPNQGHRARGYDFTAWLADYRRYKTAIRAVLPQVAFAGPDLAGATDWMEQFARAESDIALLTAHHYIMGQANPAATIDTMLAEEKKYQPALARFQAAAKAAGKPWRMCETASFSGGGKAGTSDTFAAALWALDYLFVLASYDCAGVNMETGVNHLGRISYYTPIDDDLQGHYSAAPEYYGLLAFAQAAKGEMVATACETGGFNLTAYTVHQANGICVAIINKDQSKDALVTIQGTGARQARVMRLTAPSLTAMSGVALGGADIKSDGSWQGKSQSIRPAGGMQIPAASAALVWLGD
ncbi:MAG TPA: glycosyl hydrolase family 79 C-terminal domain-containing protein [Rhizomicrobium sp.]|nr:glycosyl hydrolase family 79 C-terminal domain-containing protein [Rhizomicrobium sp.]